MSTTDVMNGRPDATGAATPELAIIGLGRMGSGMARRLLRSGHSIAALRNQFGGHAVERA